MTTENTEELIKGVESALESAIQKYEGQVEESKSAANEVRDEVKTLAEKHSELVEQSESLQSKFQEFEQSALTSMKGEGERRQTWGEKFIDSESLKAFLEGSSNRAKIEVKNTILGEGGSPQDPESVLVPEDRLPGIIPGAFRQLSVLDFFPAGATGSNQITYSREDSWTNNAAERAEGTQKPESDLTFEEINDPVRTIAHFIKLSKQVLDDAPMLQTYVDRRLRHGLRNRLEQQILSGNGTSPNISGLSASGRHTTFTPASGDNQFDSISKAKYATIGADYSANVIFMNPADWGKMERLKRGSSDDDYLVGDGAMMSYIQNGLQPIVWGLPVVASNNVPQGKFYVLDSNATQLFIRQAATVELFEQDDDNAQKNLVTVRAEMRAALAAYIPAAIRYGDLTV